MIAHCAQQRGNTVRLIKGGLGYLVKGQQGSGARNPPPKRHAGDIATFSRHSQRRFREILAMARSRNTSAQIFGFTFTIPGPQLPPEKVRQIWHAFQTEIGRQYADIAMVWRIELQTRADRRQAHWHCVLWISAKDGLPPLARGLRIAALYRKLVLDRVGDLTPKTLRGFNRYGVDILPLTDRTPSGIITYLCAHVTKRKKAQLGWEGRHWGVVNRKALTFEGDTVLEADQWTHKRAVRQFKRLKEHLKKQGRYCGAFVNPAGNVSKAIFGRDADRLIQCYDNEIRNAPEATAEPSIEDCY